MPSVGVKVHHVGMEGRCDCCPYGYHIDLDFVPFSKKMLAREGDFERLKELKDKWRSERQSMDKLLGVSKHPQSQQQSNTTWSRASRDVWDWSRKGAESASPPVRSTEHLFQNGLSEAVTDFEEALLRTRPQSKILSYEIPDSQKFHTFPRIKGPSLKDPVIGAQKNLTFASSVFSSVSTTSDSNSTSTVVNLLSIAQPRKEEEHDASLDELQERTRHLEMKVRRLREEKEELAEQLAREQAEFQLKEIEWRKAKSATRKAQKDTRDVGVNHVGPRTRSVGVGEFLPESPNGTLRASRRRTFDVAVQAQEFEFLGDKDKSGTLQIVEGIEIGVQVNLDERKPPPRRKQFGVQVTPATSDVGLMHKPSFRDVGISFSEPTTPKKNVSVSASLDSLMKIEEVKKTGRDVGTNTERLKTNTTGSNTDGEPAVKKMAVEKEEEKELDESRTSPAQSPTSPKSFPSASGSRPTGISRIPRLSMKSMGLEPSPPPQQTYSRRESPSEHRMFGGLEPLEEEERENRVSSSESSSSCIPQEREKISPSKEMQGALKVLNDALIRGTTTQQVTNAISIILHEWFRIAGTRTANPFDVEDYLDSFEIYSPQLLRYVVNMPDGNGNTALHYAVSHGNFDVVSILLDSKVCDPNKANKSGYTSIMLVALAEITTDAHRHIVRRLFSLGDVNIKAAQHGQTALMLGSSHGRLETVKLLLEAGADVNIQDEDGSTALMCAAEHGHMKIVKYLLAHPECDPQITDNEGATAFTIAMESNNKDIAVILYAQLHFTGEQRSSSSVSSTESSPGTARSVKAAKSKS